MVSMVKYRHRVGKKQNSTYAAQHSTDKVVDDVIGIKAKCSSNEITSTLKMGQLAFGFRHFTIKMVHPPPLPIVESTPDHAVCSFYKSANNLNL